MAVQVYPGTWVPGVGIPTQCSVCVRAGKWMLRSIKGRSSCGQWILTLVPINIKLRRGDLNSNCNQRGKGEGGGSRGELGEGQGVVDLQRCWGCHEGIRTTWKVGPWHTYFKKGSGAGVWSIQSGCDPSWRRVTGLKRRISANLA